MRAGWKFLTVHPDIHYAAQSGAQTASNSCKGSEHNETIYKKNLKEKQQKYVRNTVKLQKKYNRITKEIQQNYKINTKEIQQNYKRNTTKEKCVPDPLCNSEWSSNCIQLL